MDLNVCPQTVRNALNKEGLVARVKARKPLLWPRHFKARLNFCRRYKSWTAADWARVIFSDETKINQMGSDGRVYVWGKWGSKHTKREIIPTVKHGGGSLMIWGCMTSRGVGQMCEVEGIMDKVKYARILDHHILASACSLGMRGNDFVFQHDGDPKHRSGLVTDWIKDHKIKVLDWPAQSPDLNPIEHLWDHVKRQLNAYETYPTGMHELLCRVEAEWAKIPSEVTEKLVLSMPNRIKAVIEVKGGPTKY
jgi:hypothetical protein